MIPTNVEGRAVPLQQTRLLLPPPDKGAKYCDERVCLSVCVFVGRDHIFGTTRPIFTKFLCMLPMAVARSSYGSVVIR